MSIDFELVEFGPYKNEVWYKARGLNSPIVKKILDRIKKEIDTKDYSFYIYGGILEGWETKDIDMIFVGPYNIDRVREILEKVTQISYDEKFIVDIRYQFESKIFDFQEWSKGDTSLGEMYSHAILYDRIKCNGKTIEYDGYWKDDLFVMNYQQPMSKQLYNFFERNLMYKSPYKLI